MDHVTDHANVDDAGADSTEDPVGQVKLGECRGACSEQPAQARERAAERQQRPGSEFVDKESLAGGKKCLDDD